jgi:hypothetical protein
MSHYNISHSLNKLYTFNSEWGKLQRNEHGRQTCPLIAVSVRSCGQQPVSLPNSLHLTFCILHVFT